MNGLYIEKNRYGSVQSAGVLNVGPYVKFGEWVFLGWLLTRWDRRWLTEDRSSVPSVSGISGITRGSVASSEGHTSFPARVPTNPRGPGTMGRNLDGSGS